MSDGLNAKYHAKKVRKGSVFLLCGEKMEVHRDRVTNSKPGTYLFSVCMSDLWDGVGLPLMSVCWLVHCTMSVISDKEAFVVCVCVLGSVAHWGSVCFLLYLECGLSHWEGSTESKWHWEEKRAEDHFQFARSGPGK